MRGILLFTGLLGCARPTGPAPAASESTAPPVGEGTRVPRVHGPAVVTVAMPGRSAPLRVDLPAGFDATEPAGWLLEITHAASGAVLRVGHGELPSQHPGFFLAFSDDGDYRSGPGGRLSSAETWSSLDERGPTRFMAAAAGGVGLYTQLEVPLHAELVARAAFAPLIANLWVE